MKCLVFVGRVSLASAKFARDAVGTLKRLGHETTVLVYVTPEEALASFAGSVGADRVVCVCGDVFSSYDPGIFEKQLADVVKDQQPEAVFVAHTYSGRELAARLAQRLGLPLASDVVSIEELEVGRAVTKRSVHGGKAYEMVETMGSPVLVTIRPGALRGNQLPAGDSDIVEYPLTVSESDRLLELVSFESTATNRPGLEEADVVVSVGRGCNQRARELAGELADLLGAAVGSSRGNVDSGVVGYELQVGQTGKCVAPHLYIACGISGSVQHQAGMSRSEFIVAINTDENAPIFEIADYGVVGDASEVLENLVRELKGDSA